MVGKCLEVKNQNELKNECDKILSNHFDTSMEFLDLFDETHENKKDDGLDKALLKEAISNKTLLNQRSLTIAKCSEYFSRKF